MNNDSIQKIAPRPIAFDLRLGNLRSARSTFARIIRGYGRGEIAEDVYRSAIYGLSGLLAYLKTDQEIELERRLEAIEQALKETAK